jgi:epoxyqueuosine reductase QueG
VDACPSGAILGGEWNIGVKREDIFSPDKCSQYMKDKFKNIGRGAVCGICVKVCPQYKRSKEESK